LTAARSNPNSSRGIVMVMDVLLDVWR
jgi:hypothetical protein